MCLFTVKRALCAASGRVYAITRSAFTLCTVVKDVDSVECRLDTDSTELPRRLLGVLCDLPGVLIFTLFADIA